MSWETDDRSRWEAYASTVFHPLVGATTPDWLHGPGPFAIVSARTPGERLEEWTNDERHEALRARLAAATVPHAPIVGAALDGTHEELSWAVACSRGEALNLGRTFGQEAVFSIESGRILLVPCDDASAVQDVGPWKDRLLDALGGPPTKGSG